MTSSVQSALVLAMLLTVSTQELLQFDVKEEQPPPVLVGSIFSQMGLPLGPGYLFVLVSQSESFTINSTSGDLFTKVTLDRESLCKDLATCTVNVSVTVVTPMDFISVIAGVNVLDINDRIPDFAESSFRVAFSEASAPNALVSLPVAVDGDYDPRFRVQNYTLLPDALGTFDLVVNRTARPDGSVELSPNLRLLRKLDREVTASYLVTLLASDGDHVVRLPIDVTVADVNDNSPAFAQLSYAKTISETTAKDTVVLKVAATDLDAGDNGRVSYELVDSFLAKSFSSFRIAPDSGEISLARALDKQGGSTVYFKVRAYDHGFPPLSSLANVSITIEDTVNDPPTIDVVYARTRGAGGSAVAEADPAGTLVAVVVVRDSDTGNNGLTSCALDVDNFKLAPSKPPSEYVVVLTSVLDREQQAKYAVPITCWDKGSPPLSSTADLTVFVDDVNDNPPVFTSPQYQMSVKENQRPVELVGKVYATDADEGVNAQLRYYLEAGVKAFKINETTGYLYTSGPLDRENVGSYSFKVFASDMSLKPLTVSASVYVDVLDINDNAPQFGSDSYRFSVPESAAVDFFVGLLNATDPDLGAGGTVEYILTTYPSQPDPPFAISSVGGTVTLTRAVDFESEAHYNFKVIAMDGGFPRNNKSVDVWVDVLDENDNAPVIVFPGPDNQSVVLNLGVSPGHEVIQVVAHDLDSGVNGRLSYSLSAPNTSAPRLFWMNEDTGLVTLAATLTPADVQTYNIVISVHDGGEPQRATQALLRVDVVEQGPRARVQESYTTIVIIMVCVTLFVAIVVLVTLCFIKYLDKKKFNADKHHHQHQKLTFDPVSKTTAVYLTEGGGDDVMEKAPVTDGGCGGVDSNPPPFQQQRFGSQIRNGKKCVTFDSAVMDVDLSMTSDSVFTQQDNGFSGLTFIPASVSTFNRSVSPPVFNIPHKNSYGGGLVSGPLSVQLPGPPSPAPRPLQFVSSSSSNSSRSNSIANSVHKLDQGLSSASGQLSEQDQVVDAALQNHNALVRSMRHSRRAPDSARQLRPSSASHEMDLCSSSSVETSDSGHGGSELDVSVLKMNV